MFVRRVRALTLVCALLTAAASAPQAQTRAAAVTSPKAHFGFNIGDDYHLATYTQFAEYWQKIDKESNRMQVIEIGKTEEGRPHLAAIVTAPENFAKLERYKQISQQLHRARGLTDDQARALAREGKSVVWIDGGLHATEVVGPHQLIETVYQLVSRTDEETMRILRDVIVVAVHANPDGMQMVSKCYMQASEPSLRRTCSPRLYEKYAGHDNNRDFYMSNTRESQNMNKLMYWEWLPQIMYNHHQTGPAGTVIFSPPFRDPFNYNFDPMIVTGLDMVGAHMHHRFLQEGKPGFTMRSGASYSTWWNGGLRTTAYFQNIIGLLTEIIGNPTPMQIPAIQGQILPRADLPAPIEPQEWHFRQSIDYSVTANYAVLDLASRYKDQFLFNIYKMGANQIARGSRDHWTVSNEDMARLAAALPPPGGRGGPAAGSGQGGRGAGAGQAAAGGDTPDAPAGGGRGRGGLSLATYKSVLKDPARRDPRVFVIGADQADFATATKFVNALRYIGVEVHQATAPLSAGGKTYPAGSYVVKTAQAGRAHVLDMFEPQDHPNDMDERGIPRRPYDSAGWTLAYQMGVRFDRLFDDVTGALKEIDGLASPVPGRIAGTATAGYLLSPAINDSFTIVNRVLKASGDVFRLPNGAFFVPASAAATPIVQKGAQELGVNVETAASAPAGGVKLAQRRIALWDTPTGSMPSGWTRFLLERFEFPYTIVCGAGFDDTGLRAKYDVIVLPSGAAFRPGGGGGRGGGGGGGGDEPAAAGGPGGGRAGGAGQPGDPDLRSLCQVTTGTGPGATAEANVRKFVEAGGIIVAAGSAARSLADAFDLPVSEHLLDRQPGQPDRPLSADKYYVPGSVLRVAVDPAAPSAAGSEDHVDVFFNNSPVFRLAPNAAARGVRPVMWFDSDRPLRSGWAWGQNYLEGGTAAFEATVGQGKVFAFGPEITFRAQPHGTFRFLFNGILGAAK
ncbi:MAG TPA: M14 metallopeptidase family protein [Vicinamibacterales bacterium]|nr:M14 metallopeptidase family protein [Vicinamibacterales bacterium]